MGTGYYVRHLFALKFFIVKLAATCCLFPAKLHLKAKHLDLGEETSDYAIRDHDESLERAGLA